MKKLLLTVLFIFLLGCLESKLQAQGCGVVKKNTVSIIPVVNTVTQTVFVERLTPAFVFQVLPSYQQGLPQVEDTVDLITKRVLDKIKGVASLGELPEVVPEITATLNNDNGKQLDQRAIAYLQNTCFKCHHGNEGVKGSVSLFTDAGQWNPHRVDGKKLRKSLIWDVVKNGDMPPGAIDDVRRRVSSDVVKMLERWALDKN